MPLRLKGETGEETAERLLPEPDLTGEESLADAVPAGLYDDEPLDEVRPTLPGALVAAASFVPSFLAVFLGLSYLLSGGPASTAPVPTPAAPQTPVAQSSPRPSPAPSRIAREGLSAPTPPSRPDAERGPSSADPAAGIRMPDSRGQEAAAPAVPAPEVVKAPPEVKTPEVGLPPRPTPRSPEPKVTEPAVAPQVAKAPEPKVESPPVPARGPAAQPPAATRPAEPASAPGQTSVVALKSQGWIPAAAFADRAAAARLASSIQQQDYPVEIREDRSSARPWVVWIGPEPRGSSRRRR
jgi:hypothetical protein